MILDEWLERAIRSPLRDTVQTDGRIRRWVKIDEMEGRYLRSFCYPTPRPFTMHSSTVGSSHEDYSKYFADTDTWRNASPG